MTNDEVPLTRSATTEMSDRPPAAATDAGHQSDSAESGHTAGPWGFEETTLAICRLIVTVEDVEAFQVSPRKPDGELTELAIAYVPCDYNRAVQEANARLITAAPDLLQACRDAYVALPMTKHNEPINAALKAAIAKAEGERR